MICHVDITNQNDTSGSVNTEKTH